MRYKSGEFFIIGSALAVTVPMWLLIWRSHTRVWWLPPDYPINNDFLGIIGIGMRIIKNWELKTMKRFCGSSLATYKRATMQLHQ